MYSIVFIYLQLPFSCHYEQLYIHVLLVEIPVNKHHNYIINQMSYKSYMYYFVCSS